MTTDSDHVSNQAVLKGALDVLKENRHRGAWLTWREISALLAHIDAEPERLAAAVAREREEQREACALIIPYGRVQWGACDYAHAVRATPLTATPLKDALSAVENERDHLKASLVTERQRHLEALERAKAAEAERDAALTQRDTALVRVKELRQRVLDSCPSPDEGGRIHAGGRIVCGQCHDSEVSHLRAQLAEVNERLVEIRDALGLREPGQEEVPAINLLKVKLSSAVDVVRSLVASATPNPVDHPAMSLAWSAARAFLAITKVTP